MPGLVPGIRNVLAKYQRHGWPDKLRHGQGYERTPALGAEGLGNCDRCKRPLAAIDPKGESAIAGVGTLLWLQADALDSSEPLPTWGLSNPSSCGGVLLDNTILTPLHSPSLVL
jgi:hypothetical protein